MPAQLVRSANWLAKRLFDVVMALVALVLLLPIMIVIAITIYLNMGGPIIFRHRRPGQHGQPFTMLKFRTMTNDTDHNGNLLPPDQRVTRLGHILRCTSLDELPELINVLAGDMSLVGPRPLLMQYLDLYTPEQMRRHDVKPGITGWAQVNGRNDISWDERFNLDVWYADHQSLWLDIKIIALTIWKVLRRDGIGDVAAEPFQGSA
jgi:sugar transferase EpsL